MKIKSKWKDLYFRNGFGDQGCYPASAAGFHSQDIIPSGPDGPVADPNYYIEDAQWDKDLGQNTYSRVFNYIYLRGQNLGDQATVGPGKRFVSQDPFVWIPERITTGYYCLVGRVVTPAHPNKIPVPRNITSYAAYISNHPNMAWRNVSTINPADRISSRTVQYSQGDEGGEMIVTVVAEEAPLGSQISFSAATKQGANPPLVHAPETIDNEIKYTLAVTSDIVNYSTLLTYSWYSKGKTPLAGMKIVLSAIQPVDSSSELYDRACDLRELDVPADVIDRARPSALTRGKESAWEATPCRCRTTRSAQPGSRLPAAGLVRRRGQGLTAIPCSITIRKNVFGG